MTVPEAALAVIEELNQEQGGIEQQIAWRKTHQKDFQERLLRKQVALERVAAARDGVVFLDRTRIDSVAYCRLRGLELPPMLQCENLAGRYASVFVLDTLSSFSTRAETGRTSDRDLSLRVRDLVIAAYREFGYKLILVPELPLEQRVALILNQLDCTPPA